VIWGNKIWGCGVALYTNVTAVCMILQTTDSAVVICIPGNLDYPSEPASTTHPHYPGCPELPSRYVSGLLDLDNDAMCGVLVSGIISSLGLEWRTLSSGTPLSAGSMHQTSKTAGRSVRKCLGISDPILNFAHLVHYRCKDFSRWHLQAMVADGLISTIARGRLVFQALALLSYTMSLKLRCELHPCDHGSLSYCSRKESRVSKQRHRALTGRYITRWKSRAAQKLPWSFQSYQHKSVAKEGMASHNVLGEHKCGVFKGPCGTFG
jgi:hypothetical protein